MQYVGGGSEPDADDWRRLSPPENEVPVVVPVAWANCAGSRGPARLRAALRDAAHRPLADLVVDAQLARWGEQLRWAEGQVAAVRAAAPIIGTLPADQVARQVARLAERLQLPAAEVTALVLDVLTGTPGRVGTTPARTPAQLTQPGYPTPVSGALAAHTPAPLPADPPPLTPGASHGRAQPTYSR